MSYLGRAIITFVNRDGRIRVGDEILMINGKSVLGDKLSEVRQKLKDSPSPIELMIATEVRPCHNNVMLMVMFFRQ